MLKKILNSYQEYRLLFNHQQSLKLTGSRHRQSRAFVKLAVKYSSDESFDYLDNLSQKNILSLESVYIILKFVNKHKIYALRQMTDYVIEYSQGVRTRLLLNRLDKAIAERGKKAILEESAERMIRRTIDDLTSLLEADLTPQSVRLAQAIPTLLQLLTMISPGKVSEAQSLQIFTLLSQIILLKIDDEYVCTLSHKGKSRLAEKMMRLNRDHIIPLKFFAEN